MKLKLTAQPTLPGSVIGRESSPERKRNLTIRRAAETPGSDPSNGYNRHTLGVTPSECDLGDGRGQRANPQTLGFSEIKKLHEVRELRGPRAVAFPENRGEKEGMTCRARGSARVRGEEEDRKKNPDENLGDKKQKKKPRNRSRAESHTGEREPRGAIPIGNQDPTAPRVPSDRASSRTSPV